jgi:tetratricopeptide (TPR) repeat protein
VALLFSTTTALAQQQAGDPAPDTKDAADQLRKSRYEDAITASKRALARDERYVPAMLVMAKAYYGLKKYELATAIIDNVRALDANNADAYNVLGFIALTRNDSTSATASFKKATELDEKFGNAWNNLTAQYLLAKNYDAALESGEKAAGLLPRFDKAHLNLGAAYRGKGQYEQAEKEFRKALELNTTYADAYFNLGVLYLDAPQMPNMDLPTKLNTAINHFNKYKQLASYKLTKDDPSDGYIDEARKTIDREQKRIERERKKKERDAAKKAPAAATEEKKE